MGWKYVAAEEESQKYKIGKFILETKRINTASCWEGGRNGTVTSCGAADHELVEFDSQDEDECEELFSGMWSPAVAVLHRRKGTLGSKEVTMKEAPATK